MCKYKSWKTSKISICYNVAKSASMQLRTSLPKIPCNGVWTIPSPPPPGNKHPSGDASKAESALSSRVFASSASSRESWTAARKESCADYTQSLHLRRGRGRRGVSGLYGRENALKFLKRTVFSYRKCMFQLQKIIFQQKHVFHINLMKTSNN